MSPIRPNRRRRRSWTPEPGTSEALDREGKAIVPGPESGQPREARVDGALAGERFVFLRTEREGDIDRARVVEVLEPAAERVEARCVHYGVCGGCSLMHMHPDAQVAHKQAVLLGDLARHGLRPDVVLEPLRAEPWGYRRRARLGAKWVANKNEVVVGFREKDHRFIARLAGCEVLAGNAGALISPLAELIGSLELRDRIPQIEVSIGDEPDDRALVLRVLAPPSDEDRARLLEFGQRERVRMFLQPGGLDSVFELGDSPDQGASAGLLHYRLPAHELELGFRPTDFVQVNGAINRAMVDRAIELLELEPGQRVLDLFCGLGNFSLAVARHVAEVVALEGDAGLVARARANAEANALTNLRFASCDLYGEFAEFEQMIERDGPFDRVLIDPPRSGALKLVERFDRIAAPRVVYVACSPETLARDLAILVERHGYRLRAAGIIDMFPHTAHVESIALVER
jgi:23S rRNA (uracil1939-C5)-methyltransferase